MRIGDGSFDNHLTFFVANSSFTYVVPRPRYDAVNLEDVESIRSVTTDPMTMDSQMLQQNDCVFFLNERLCSIGE